MTAASRVHFDKIVAVSLFVLGVSACSTNEEGPWQEKLSLTDSFVEFAATPVGSVTTATVVVLYSKGYSFSGLSPIEEHVGSPFSYTFGDASIAPTRSRTNLMIRFEPVRSGFFEETVYVNTNEPQDPFTLRAEAARLLVTGLGQ